MKLPQNSVKALEEAIRQTAEKLSQHAGEALLTDLYVKINADNGTVEIHDDDDNCLASCQVPEWKGHEPGADFCESAIATLQRIINDNAKAIEQMKVLRPFSFVLSDDGEIVDDIYLVDDENMMISGELMAGLDEDLADFLKKLMDE